MPSTGTAAAHALEQLGSLSLREHSTESLLQAVADAATSTVAGAAEASVTLLVCDDPLTTVSAGEVEL